MKILIYEDEDGYIVEASPDRDAVVGTWIFLDPKEVAIWVRGYLETAKDADRERCGDQCLAEPMEPEDDMVTVTREDARVARTYLRYKTPGIISSIADRFDAALKADVKGE